MPRRVSEGSVIQYLFNFEEEWRKVLYFSKNFVNFQKLFHNNVAYQIYFTLLWNLLLDKLFIIHLFLISSSVQVSTHPWWVLFFKLFILNLFQSFWRWFFAESKASTINYRIKLTDVNPKRISKMFRVIAKNDVIMGDVIMEHDCTQNQHLLLREILFAYFFLPFFHCLSNWSKWFYLFAENIGWGRVSCQSFCDAEYRRRYFHPLFIVNTVF